MYHGVWRPLNWRNTLDKQLQISSENSTLLIRATYLRMNTLRLYMDWLQIRLRPNCWKKQVRLCK